MTIYSPGVRVQYRSGPRKSALGTLIRDGGNMSVTFIVEDFATKNQHLLWSNDILNVLSEEQFAWLLLRGEHEV